MLRALTLLPLLLVPLAPAPTQDRGAEVTDAYHAAFSDQDADALIDCWRENPGLVLVAIDADLEGALKLRESSEAPDEAAIAELHARALFGARAAERATGHPILVDYASSFVGWNAEQQRDFRAGQAAYGRARQASRDGDHAAAAAAGRECQALAEPLGDWWGAAMGLSAEGAALLALGEQEEALARLARARLIHHDLGLYSSESGNLRGMLDALLALDRSVRAAEVARQALALAKELGDEEGAQELQTLLDGADR